MTDHESFLAAIKKDPENQDLRMVFSDWLLEHNMPEESDRQRKIVPAIQWLKEFAKKWNFNDADHPYAAGHYDSQKHVWVDDPSATANPNAWLDMVESAMEDNYITAHGTDLHGASELDAGDEDEFWKCMEIYTGKKFDQDRRDDFTWSCSC